MRKLSQMLGHQNHTTVQGWWDREVIPARRQAEILELARREGVDITADDLIVRPAKAA